jgi:GNAT superfamily N-acetyltransferase
MDFRIREARLGGLGDETALFALIHELARFERLEHTVTGSAAELGQHLFGEPSRAEALIAEAESGEALGFALFFGTYSTFLTLPGLYLEDLFVVPQARRRGIGTALLREVGQLARERKLGRLEWAVLDWNSDAIAFYEKLGASVLPDWRICRVTGAALERF